MSEMPEEQDAPPDQPSAIARAIAMTLVTRYRLRLTHASDSRLGPLTTGYELGAGMWTGTRSIFVGIFSPDANDPVGDVQRRIAQTYQWGSERLSAQPAKRCDILLIATGPIAGAITPPAADGPVGISVVSLDVARGDAVELLGSADGLPSVRELRSHARAVRDGTTAPTLAAVDLAERQTVQGGYNQPVQATTFNRPYAAIGLIAAWVLVWLVEHLIIQSNPHVSQYDFGILVAGPGVPIQWWQLVSYGFLHMYSTPLHIALNSLAMFWIGRLIEQLYGRLVLVASFLICTVGAGLVAILIGPATAGAVQGIAVVGASGGICGLIGMMLVIGRVQGRNVPAGLAANLRNNMLANVVFILVYSFVISGISWQAHLGGFITGALVGIAVPPLEQIGGRRLRGYESGVLWLAIAVGIVALGIAAGNVLGVINGSTPSLQ